MTPGGRSVIGVYDHPPPADSAIEGKQLDADVTPLDAYNEGIRRTIKLAAWITHASNELEELLAS